MTKKRTYRTVHVHQIDIAAVVEQLGSERRAIVAIDIAKVAMVAGLANAQGRCVALFRFAHPTETRAFLLLVEALRTAGVTPEVVMEPTGVYGDALRHQLVRAGIAVFRMDAKRVHDAAEILDGVPSMHDPKACTVLAHLHAQGLSRPWRERTAVEHELRSLVDERDLFAKPFERACGQLEAVVARHWPELSAHIDPARRWHLHLLNALPGPEDVAAAPEHASDVLDRASRRKLSRARVDQIVALARGSLGVPMTERDRSFVRTLTRHMLDLAAHVREVEARIRDVVAAQSELRYVVDGFGAVTTAAIVGDIGNPASFQSTAAFEKALGLNLKVRSSGKHVGRLRITKRGPARARRYLFLAALRFIAHYPTVRRWYEARASYRAGNRVKAVVSVMRKLSRAMVHVARGATFDPAKLFDTRRLPHTSPPPDSTSLLVAR